MKILSQYYLANYVGKEILTLGPRIDTMSSGFNSLSVEITNANQYNTFLDGISTIYGGQTSSGTIPVFWTVTDNNGNNIPSPDSTLSGLIPLSSYYFISNSSNVLPLVVPLIGGVNNSALDRDFLPSIENSMPDNSTRADVVLTSGTNYYHFSPRITNLQPKQTYQYIYTSLGSNWPGMISPVSGTISPSANTFDLDTLFYFCPTSGSCPSGVGYLGKLPYVLESYANKDFARKNYYNIINLSIWPIEDPSKSVNTTLDIQCENCLPACISYANVIFSSGPNLVVPSGCCATDQSLIVAITNTIPGDRYTYSFSSISEDILFIPTTGEIYFGSEAKGNILSLMNLNNQGQDVITCTLTHEESGTISMDTMLINCGNTC